MGSAQGCWWRPCMPRLGGAQALPPAPPQHWHLLCRFLLLSLPTLLDPAEVVQLPPAGTSVCPPPSCSPSPLPVPLTVCLLSPRPQDSCSQDSSTEMVGCSARLMPGFSFSWQCFPACSAPGIWLHHLPRVWVLRGAAVTKGSLKETHFGAAKWF